MEVTYKDVFIVMGENKILFLIFGRKRIWKMFIFKGVEGGKGSEKKE